VKILNIRVKTLANLFGSIWIGCIVSFFGLAFVLRSQNVAYATNQGPAGLAIIITGVLSFALAFVLYFLHFVNSDSRQVKKKAKKKKSDNFANVKHGALVSSVVGLSIIGILLLVALLAKGTSIISGSSTEQASTPPIEATSAPVIESPTPTTAPVYVDPDPIVNCGPGQNSGQYVKDKQSNCKNYVDCGFSNNVWTLMLSSECDKKHADANPPCTISFYGEPAKTFNISPEACKQYQQEQANWNNRNTNIVQPVQQTQQPVIDYAAQNQRNIELQAQCMKDVAVYCQQQQSEINGRRDLGDSGIVRLKENLNAQCSQQRSNCQATYPTN
jgi:hypothetical protein